MSDIALGGDHSLVAHRRNEQRQRLADLFLWLLALIIAGVARIASRSMGRRSAT